MKRRIRLPDISEITFCSSIHRAAICAGISSRNIAKNLVRVKSSNVWAYAINIRRDGDRTGDVYVQFKGKDGGPEDIYVYFDVPIQIYRRWQSAPSKGHFFWQYIRNKFQYAKLTGDRRTKLKNGVDNVTPAKSDR